MAKKAKKKVTKKKAARKVVKKTTKKAAAKTKVKKKVTKKKATKSLKKKVAPAKKAAKKKAPAKAIKKTAKPKATVKAKEAPKKATPTPKVEAKSPSPKQKKISAKDAQRAMAEAALKEALEESANEEISEEEFDPEAFFAASGGQSFRAHVMRKERVDINLQVRFRMKGPLVHHAELLNLSKGGLCLKTNETIAADTILKIEIPLPHTSELFSVHAKSIWSQSVEVPEYDPEYDDAPPIHTGLLFEPMSLAKQSVINNFIQQRRDEIVMAKIGLDKFSNSAPVAGVD